MIAPNTTNPEVDILALTEGLNNIPDTPEPRVQLAAGHRMTCPDCKGSGEVQVGFALFSCERCFGAGPRRGRGTILVIYGPKDERQRKFEALVEESEFLKGEALTFEERQVERDRVRASRPVREVVG